MRKLTTSTDSVFYVFMYITENNTRNIDMSTVSVTLKYHYFEEVAFAILDFEGHKYEEIDYFSWWCANGPR